MISEGQCHLGLCEARVLAVCCSQLPLSPEDFASALISLEIKFSSVLLNVKMFFLRIYSTMSEILIFKIVHSLILPHLLYPQLIQFLWQNSAKRVTHY